MEWKIEPGGLAVCRLSGKLTFREWYAMNADGSLTPANGAKLRVLVVLDGFEGWDRAEGWEDPDIAERNDELVERMAVVGAERWRHDAEMFTLKGFRPFEIRFFRPDEVALARAWLEML